MTPARLFANPSMAADESHPLVRDTAQAAALACIYALFVVFFPWEWIQRNGFSDFDNYVADFNYYASEGASRTDLIAPSNWREYLLSEALWDLLGRSLTLLFGEAAIAMRLLSFVTLFIWGLYLFRRVRPGIALLFLLNPLVIDVAMSLIRNGFAWALVIVALQTRSRALRLALFAVGILFHTTVAVLLALYYFSVFARHIFTRRMALVSGIGAGVMVGLAITIGSQLVLGALGDRRTGEDYLVGGGSLLQASIWGLLLLLQAASSHAYVRSNLFIVALLAWYLTMNPFIPFAWRVWACLLPLVAVSALSLSAAKRQIFMIGYCGYFVLWWLYWTKLFDYWHPA